MADPKVDYRLRSLHLPPSCLPITLADVEDAAPAADLTARSSCTPGNPLLPTKSVPVSNLAPLIYTRVVPITPLSIWARLFAGAIGGGCLIVLGIAARLTPSTTGMGTHMQLGLQDCGFKLQFGLPCPSCGYTTAYTWFAHGHVLRSFYTQPMGCVLAFFTAAMVWGGLYIGITGRPVHRLLRFLPSRYYLLPLLLFGVLAWAWKIFLTLRGWE